MNKETVLLGIKINIRRFQQLLDCTQEAIKNGKQIKVAYANPHVLNSVYGSKEMTYIFNHFFNFIYPDGIGVILVDKLWGKFLERRVSLSDSYPQLFDFCIRQGYSIYFLGGKRKIIDKAKVILQEHFPSLRVAGFMNGFYFEENMADEEIVRIINEAAPHVLLVGLGTPRQEKWIYRHARHLRAPVLWTCGSLLSIIAGERKKPPSWVKKLHLEWLNRWLDEPLRLFNRYIVGNPKFTYRVLKEYLRQGLSRNSTHNNH